MCVIAYLIETALFSVLDVETYTGPATGLYNRHRPDDNFP